MHPQLGFYLKRSFINGRNTIPIETVIAQRYRELILCITHRHCTRVAVSCSCGARQSEVYLENHPFSLKCKLTPAHVVMQKNKGIKKETKGDKYQVASVGFSCVAWGHKKMLAPAVKLAIVSLITNWPHLLRARSWEEPLIAHAYLSYDPDWIPAATFSARMFRTFCWI